MKLSLHLRAALLLPALLAPAAPLPLRLFTVRDGLAENHINRLRRDRLGRLWICTDGGLSYFDGSSLLNFTPESGLPHPVVNDLLETTNGDLWLGTDAGLCRFQPAAHSIPERCPAWQPPRSKAAAHVNGLLGEPPGTLLLATSDGLFRFDPATTRFSEIPLPYPPNTTERLITALARDPHGRIWAASRTGLYLALPNPNQQWTRFGAAHGLTGDFVEDFGFDRDRNTWVCLRSGGLARLVPHPQPDQPIVHLRLTTGLPDLDVRAFLQTPDRHLWVATTRGLAEFHPTSLQLLRRYDASTGFPSSAITKLIEDAAGNLWFGTYRDGVGRIPRPAFSSVIPTLGAGSNPTLLLAPTGGVCLAALLHRQPALSCPPSTAAPPIQSLNRDPGAKWPHGLLHDSAQSWWLPQHRALIRFPLRHAPIALPADSPWAVRLLEDHARNVWIATEGDRHHLLRWNRATGSLDTLDANLPLDARRGVSAIAQHPSGALWIGLFPDGGIARLNGTRWERFDESHGIPAGQIRALRFDRHQRLWIASSEGGLARIDQPAAARPTSRIFTTRDGLSSNSIWALAFDLHGRLYAATSRALDLLDPDATHVRHFTADEGLPAGIPQSVLTGPDGSVWVASEAGLASLDPSLSPTSPSPFPWISSVRRGDELLIPNPLGHRHLGPLTFPHAADSITLTLSSADYRSTLPPRYLWRLEDGSAAWSPPSPDPTIRLAGLRSGAHRLTVRLAGAPAEASLAFTILPPFYQRPWFLALAAASLLSAGFLAHRIALQRRLAVEQVRLRIASDLHDDIGASLTRIALLSDLLQHHAPPASESRLQLETLAANARSLIASMNEIIWAADPRRDTLADLASRIRQCAAEQLDPRGIRWHFDAPPHHLSLRPELRRHAYCLFKEALHNAARHSRATTLRLSLTIVANSLHGTIEDNGAGFDPTHESTGLGLDSLRRRAAATRGSITIQSAPGAGAVIRFQLPLHQGRVA